MDQEKIELNKFYQRYSRQLILKGWSFKKQQQVKNTVVCLNGIYKLPYYSLACLGIEKFFMPKNTPLLNETFKKKLLSLNSNIEFIDNIKYTDTHLTFHYEKVSDLYSSFPSDCRNNNFILNYRESYLDCTEYSGKKSWSLTHHPYMNIELSYSVLINKVILDFI